MKHLAGITRLALLMLLVLPPALIDAQDDEGLDIPEDLAGFFVQAATSGTLTDNGDGTYTLTLAGVTGFIPWVINAPELNAARMDTFIVVRGWAAAEALDGVALLETADATVLLTLAAPDYDDLKATLTYTTVVDDILAGEETKEGLKAPETFGAATLFITVDADFLAGLSNGLAASLGGIRGFSLNDVLDICDIAWWLCL